MGMGGGGSQQSSDPKAAERVRYKEQQKRKTNEVDAHGNPLYRQRRAAKDAATSADEWFLAYEAPIANPDAPLLSDDKVEATSSRTNSLVR